MGRQTTKSMAVEQQCRIWHGQLEPREKPTPGEPGYCDRCLRDNQSTPAQYVRTGVG